MLVHLNMLRAFRGARPTGISTGRNEIVGDIHVGAGPAGGNRPGCNADVGAVEIEPNALNEFTDVRLAKAGVCATRANLSAAVAILYAAHQRVCRTPVYIRMAIHHFTYKHRFPRGFFGCVPPTMAMAKGSEHGTLLVNRRMERSFCKQWRGYGFISCIVA
ncbi:hypothetical protein [Ensifer canadensis]|uniref:hypothetical protein n=1 Tax=Ensifer canadensis TaxID=555315 RepID=UPI00148FF420